jgi:hypothetical protein
MLPRLAERFGNLGEDQEVPMGPSRRPVAVACLLATLAAPLPVAAEVITGRAAQALRCAAYISMTATYLRERGEIARTTYDGMMMASTYILVEWVPLDDPMPAYEEVLKELGDERGTYARFTRHVEFCLREFGPR